MCDACFGLVTRDSTRRNVVLMAPNGSDDFKPLLNGQLHELSVELRARPSSSHHLRKHLFLLSVFFVVTIISLFYVLDGALPRFQSTRQFSRPAHVRISGGHGSLVNTPACSIPDLDPMDPSVRSFIYTPQPITCSNEEFVFTSEGEALHMRPDAFDYYTCCYQTLTRAQVNPKKRARNVDNLYNYSTTCVPITSTVTVISEEFIRITCHSVNETSSFKDFHAFVPTKPKVEERCSQARKPSPDQMSVLIIGVDAVSRLNMIRQLPETRKYLTKHLGAVELYGYNKVADNTFPNLVPVLSGFSESELQQVCWATSDSTFDECPWMWDYYSKNGYRTSFGEDAPWMGLFSYQKVGFQSQPTDYYLRPIAKAMEDEIGHRKEGNAKLCYGQRLALQSMLDYVEKMSLRFARDLHFTFMWTVSLSHDYLNFPHLGDVYYRDTLRTLHEKGALENTVVILMSDHGIRWGKIRETYQGEMEERLPFVTFVFPPSFRTKYNDAFRNLVRNTHMLTTPYDLHETLMDLADMRQLKPATLRRRAEELDASLPRGISLFLPVPEERTCNQSGIADHWCTCHQLHPVPVNDTNVVKCAQYLVQSLNDMLRPYSQCATLTVASIRDARASRSNNPAFTSKGSSIPAEYTLIVEAEPSKAMFEATIRYNLAMKTFKLSDSVSRINVYGNQSYCVDDYNMKKYCYCL